MTFLYRFVLSEADIDSSCLRNGLFLKLKKWKLL